MEKVEVGKRIYGIFGSGSLRSEGEKGKGQRIRTEGNEEEG